MSTPVWVWLFLAVGLITNVFMSDNPT
ncbi:hypothetical protein SEA_ESPICA_55 [Rhodococcus phage Espica]|nr:hypothetical protein SEA_SHUMAN_55 [Rhodococcus phage Shuman]QBI96217.1 hypothetical protein SEA_ESPICA_55 [Rhodococcus phage Espica]QBI96871.1 hypothetical protein SEA_BELENARIA_55 [Rhodococcus phage Belenaria]